MAKGAWLSVMPVIPLTDAVPVRFLDPKWKDAVVSLVGSNGQCDHWWRGDGYGDPGYRVNLAHPQGFAYVLRWLISQEPLYARATLTLGIDRHLTGQTTEADRLALARACAAIVDVSEEEE